MNKNSKILWISLFFISLAGIALYLINSYTLEGPKIFKNGIVVSRTGVNLWKEYLIVPFYFTFISNVFALITSSWVLINIINNNNITNKHLIRLKLLMPISLAVTLIVYWSLIAPNKITQEPPQMLIRNIFVHGLTPLLAITTYTYDVRTNPTPKFNFKKTVCFLLLLPLIWIIFATILYFSLGGNYEDAIYSFLRYCQNKWWMTIIYILGIAFSFILFSFCFITINNKSNNISKQIV